MNRSSFMIIFSSIVLLLSLRGIVANPRLDTINSPQWTTDGPFELSPERGRFALTYSLVEDKSFYFSLPIARFAIPDLGYLHGHYVSLFAPLVSFVTIPGYIIGKYFGASQIGTFAVIAVFALFNTYLIRTIAIRLGANTTAATLAAISFLFATPAYAYAVNLYQHHISTFLILINLYVLLRYKNLWSTSLVFLICAAAIPLDYPNAIFLFPIGLYAITNFISIKQTAVKYIIHVFPFRLVTLLSMIVPLIFFCWFNIRSYDKPFQLSGTVPSVNEIDSAGKPTKPKDITEITDINKYINPDTQNKSAVGFFKTRNILNGFYVNFISPDRGTIYYATVILYGIAGLYIAYRRNMPLLPLTLAILGANILLYAMWGDPWGGWAFGSRYLIPAYAILSIYLAIALTYLKKTRLFIISFLIVFIYSVAVNTLGSITTSADPPQVEVWQLEKITHTVQKYTYIRNWDFLQKNKSKSFVFQTYAHQYMTATDYYIYITLFISVYGTFLISRLRQES